MKRPRRVAIMGAAVDVVSVCEVTALLDEQIKYGRSPVAVYAVNPEKILASRFHPWLKECLAGAGLLLADGVGVVLAARATLGLAIPRATGVDVMESLCAAGDRRGYRVFLYGATEAVNRDAAEALGAKYPGLAIVGRENGYHSVEENSRIVAKINSVAPDVLFVALGSPKQEEWVHTHLSRLNVKVCQGVGGSLDVVAGRVRRAPEWMRGIGAEWLYRVLRQPSRVGRQRRLVLFAWEMCREAVGRIRVSASQT